MIRIEKPAEITVAELMEEAISSIPLYTGEWTNFNASEPGITVLEQLSGVAVLQQEHINQMPSLIQEELLAMLGFKAMALQCARVLLKAEHLTEDIIIPALQQFRVDHILFETDQDTIVSASNLIGVYAGPEEDPVSCENILHKEILLDTEIFGKNPREQDKVYFLFDQPLPRGQIYTAYIFTGREIKRNQPQAGDNLKFAEIRWEYYTKEGFVPITCQDHTFCLLMDGEISFSIPESAAAVYDGMPQKGFAIRGTLIKAAYDLPPRLAYICFGLFEVWQKETDSVCFTFPARECISLSCDLLAEEYIQVFCKEKGEESYRAYQEDLTGNQSGRYYTKIRQDYGLYQFYFNQEGLLDRLAADKDAVRIVVYNEKIMRQYDLGCVFGYDDQIIKLPVKNSLAETFCLIAERTDFDGEAAYDFIYPDDSREGKLWYTLSDVGEICIRDAGNYIESRLFLGSCSVTLGEEGNIRSDNRLIPLGYDTDTIFHNPAAGSGGRYKENNEQVRRRFLNDLEMPYAAVKAADYEALVMRTPGLCIHKTKAIMGDGEQQVQLAVKPYSYEKFPVLSQAYREIIMEHLEKSRLLCTEISLIQPVYAAVDVTGTIYVKKHYENCRQQIEDILRKELDFIHGEQGFGDVLVFTRIFRKIEELPCVAFIYDLSLQAQNVQFVERVGVDLKAAANSLFYPGTFYLEINEFSNSYLYGT